MPTRLTRANLRSNASRVLGFVLTLLLSFGSLAMEPNDEVTTLLQRADTIKTSSHEEFKSILQLLEQRAPGLTPPQQAHVRYLRGWEEAYMGEYERAIATLKPLIGTTTDATLRFRARATVANVFNLSRRYEEALSELSEFLEELDAITEGAARDQGLAVAALLYGEVGQHDLSLTYADQLIKENWNGRGACRGGQIKVRALYDRSRPDFRPPSLDEEIRKGIDACVGSGELVFANAIRSHEVRLLMERGESAQALELLRRHYDEVQMTRYPRLVSQWDVMLAQIYWRMNDVARARQFALRSVEGAVKNEYTEPLIAAYQLLYSIEKHSGDEQEALEYHEKYSVADKGYLDDISARQLAFERVKHEVAANKMQIESLTLQRELDAKAIENVRLYVTLLLVILGFIVFWAYRTKRSQLHFMNLARRDGLTGIFNRPHFMELAAGTLENCDKLKQEVALVLCDLDNFKQINDRYGHAEGDSVLKHMVSACQTHLRAADIFGRIGGEEFCVLLPGCGADDARLRAEELRKAIATITEKSRATISASFGVTSTTLSGYELHQLLAHADTALYQAKRTGRNCVIVYDKESVITTLRPGSLSSAR